MTSLCATGAIGLRLANWHGAEQNVLHLMRTQAKNTQVALSGATVERNLGFVTVTGNVHNNTGHVIRQMEAVVELVDPQNHTVAVESALIGQDALAGGETAPFQVEMADNSHAVSYRVHFRKLLGASLD